MSSESLLERLGRCCRVPSGPNSSVERSDELFWHAIAYLPLVRHIVWLLLAAVIPAVRRYRWKR
ncbi:hypothetical protein E2C01_038664 [Portunus trituberculatus]|uniref:Uncharacterized protein n=1 Tax=Portunus trituberculatus TaxID=210409 RepID=A0A5B7FCT2_PORTR|nr:hypothetical protein [Portunus trituberculatus]